jgi:hypothetical protein
MKSARPRRPKKLEHGPRAGAIETEKFWDQMRNGEKRARKEARGRKRLEEAAAACCQEASRSHPFAAQKEIDAAAETEESAERGATESVSAVAQGSFDGAAFMPEEFSETGDR